MNPNTAMFRWNEPPYIKDLTVPAYQLVYPTRIWCQIKSIFQKISEPGVETYTFKFVV